MGATVTDDESRHIESWKDYILENPDYYSHVIFRRGYNLDPFQNIVDNNKYVVISKGRRERSHEIDSPYIKDFNFQNALLRHLIASRDFSSALALVAIFKRDMDVFLDNRPI